MFYSTIILLLFILTHYFAGQLIYNTFSFEKRKYLAYLIPFLITFLFLLSTVLINYGDLLFFNYIYIITAVLFGFLTQILIFGTIFFLLKFIIVRRRKLAKILFSLVIIMFLLGTYNAFFPRVKKIEINDPNNIKDKIKIVHLSDLHLGLIYRPAYLEKLVTKVNNLEGDVVVISGDLFDGNDPEIQKFIPALKKFSGPVVFVPGNHDHYVDNDLLATVISDAGLIELKNEAYMLKGVEFIGFDYLSDKDSNIRREIDNLNTNKKNLRVVINHVPVDQAEAYALKADLMLSGHTHRGQISPFSIVVRQIYSDFSYGLSNYKEMITYTSAGVGTFGPPLRTLSSGEIVMFYINNK